MKRVTIHHAKEHVFSEKIIVEANKEYYRTMNRKGIDILQAKERYDKATKSYKKSKAQYKKLNYQRGLRYTVKKIAKANMNKTTQNIFAQDEELNRLNNARHYYRQAEQAKYTVKQGGKVTKRVVHTSSDKLYGLGNRAYNKYKGRGFILTPKEFSWYRQLQERIRQKQFYQYVHRFKKNAKRVFNPTAKVIGNVLRNPFSFGGLFGFLLVIAVVSSFFGGVGIVKQSEFDLSDTWLYFTKLDREHSNDKVVYWSDVDDYLYYINYRYDHYTKRLNLDSREYLKDNILGQQLADELWRQLNGNSDKLKTIKDLYNSSDELFKLSDKHKQEYEDMLNLSGSIGKYRSLSELDNFFFTSKEANYNQPLRIVSRFGYTSRSNISYTSTFKGNPGQNVISPMFGTVTSVKDNHVVITSDNKRITFETIDNPRVTEGQEIQRGELIGQIKPEGNQVVKYEKSRPKKDGEKDKEGNPVIEWVPVNIGFYMSNVIYTQKTSIISNISTNGEKSARVQKFTELIKKYYPEATNEGIAAILGNFDIESGINPKLAEGDHLAPPVGKTDDSSYDNPEWLNIGGVPIYGKYPNILRRGIGLGQWTDTADGSTRHTMLREYATVRSKKWYDFDLQVDFMANGDSPYYKEVLRQVLTNTDEVDNLTELFLIKWEGNEGDKTDARKASARAWLEFLNRNKNTVPGVATELIPEQYRDILPLPLPTEQVVSEGQGYPGNAYALGNCTWYVYNRMAQLGENIYPYLGNANAWANSGIQQGYVVTDTPKVGSMVAFDNSVDGASRIYGHVAFCEYVNPDGSFLISEMNYLGLYKVSYRVLYPKEGIKFITLR